MGNVRHWSEFALIKIEIWNLSLWFQRQNHQKLLLGYESADSGAGGIANPFVEAWKVWLPKEASARKQDLPRKLEKQKVHNHSVSNLW